jgi:branched-chain amino acid transport system substrate-binding protein
LTPIFLFISIILAIIIGDSLIIFASPEDRPFYSNWVLVINSFLAASIATYITLRDREIAGRLKVNVLLLAGLALWTVSNIIWAYYEIVLDVASPMPSWADFFLLSAYFILIARFLIEYKTLAKKPSTNFRVCSGILVSIFFAYIIYISIDLSVLSTPRGWILLAVTIAYPIFNSILLLTAVMILVSVIKEGKENQLHIRWVCELFGFLAVVIGDSWFSIIVLTGFLDQLWMSALLLSAHYLIIAGGLIWYLKFESRSDKTIDPKAGHKKPITLKGKNVVVPLIVGLSLSLLVPIYWMYSSNSSDKFSSSSSYLGVNVINQNITVVPIGAITSLTGAWSSGGKAIEVALGMAQNDVNTYLAQKNSTLRVDLLVEDSKTDPNEAIHAIERLARKGVKIVIGPATSSAVMAVKDFADKNDIILISPSSTSPALSIPDDNLLRFVPDDSNQGVFIARKMWDDGIRAIVPMWREDTFGSGLTNQTKESFEKLGGVVLDEVKYHPYVGHFASSLHRVNFIIWNKYLKELSSIVYNATQNYGNTRVAVYLVSYDEVTPILIHAIYDEGLSRVTWYGSDSSAQNLQVIRNHDSGQFAKTVNFTNPLYSIESENNKKLEVLESRLKSRLHEPGSATYPALAYDAFWVAAVTSEKIMNQSNVDTRYLRDLITSTAESHEGISGEIRLNENGDRLDSSYDLWTVTQPRDNSSEMFEWKQS